MSAPIVSFVCWKWLPPNGTRPVFESHHVNVLRAMIERHYARPHRFICITDDARGLDPRIEVIPMPVRFDAVPSPSGERFPSCYCRLWNFSRQARELLGERIFSIDIDVVVVADIVPLVERSESFVGWSDEKFGWKKIAGGAYLLKAGAMPHVWDQFDPLTSPRQAHEAGCTGSDQGWMSYCMYPPAGRWTRADGLQKVNWTPFGAARPPSGARIVFTSGKSPPWNHLEQVKYPWIKDHWTL